MKTLKEKFEEILDETCVGGCDNGRHNYSKPAIKDLIQAVREYNKEVVGEDCRLSLNPNSITNKYKQVVNEEHEEIRQRQAELLG